MLHTVLNLGATNKMSWNFPYESITSIMDLLDRKELAMSKKFGQNFLLSKDVRKRIVNTMELSKDMKVWEIGPGIGSITSLILEEDVNLTAFEIDYGFCKILANEAFGDEAKFTLVEGDALKTTISTFKEIGTPDVVCGNLPYNVGSVCIAKLLENKCHPKKMVYTLQKEVAQRLCADSGSKLYSAFSVLAQIDYNVSIVMDINSQAFYPVPNVVSSVIVMNKRRTPLVEDELRDTFIMVVRDLFSKRRKTIKNNLISGRCGKLYEKEVLLEAIENSGVPSQARAEKLTINDFKKISKGLFSLKK
ncbi:MAG: 16S rRNA (adenine(1518)-N(6)/adenine(1519)-N(6))-dimethyltransferase RsmA [Pleomorphochaeta sp.]